MCFIIKKKKNDLRETARRNGVYLYEIAEALGVSEQTFIRWLRKDLTERKKEDALAAIELISTQREESAND